MLEEPRACRRGGRRLRARGRGAVGGWGLVKGTVAVTSSPGSRGRRSPHLPVLSAPASVPPGPAGPGRAVLAQGSVGPVRLSHRRLGKLSHHAPTPRTVSPQPGPGGAGEGSRPAPCPNPSPSCAFGRRQCPRLCFWTPRSPGPRHSRAPEGLLHALSATGGPPAGAVAGAPLPPEPRVGRDICPPGCPEAAGRWPCLRLAPRVRAAQWTSSRCLARERADGATSQRRVNEGRTVIPPSPPRRVPSRLAAAGRPLPEGHQGLFGLRGRLGHWGPRLSSSLGRRRRAELALLE